MRGTLAAAVLLALSSGHALADAPAPSSIELGLFGGGFVSNYYHQFYDYSLFPGGPGDPNGREELRRVSPLTGVRFAYFLRPWLGIEAEATWIATQTKMSQEAANIYGGRAQVMLQYPTERVIPFITLGDGFAHVSSDDDVLGSDTDWPVHVGIGARFLIQRSIAIRVDARLLRAPSLQEPYHLNASLGEFMLGISYRPGARLAVDPGPAPDVDSDGDGLLDSADRCPREAEDKDMFDDSDGCPDVDNDNDAIADAQDKCALDAEDKDGFEDDDGCVDPDNDGDAIGDAQDKCRDQAEDKDGFQDADGCAEIDNDRDGFVDAQDKCPSEAEMINGVDDDDGCPDRGESLVVVLPDRFELLEGITFKKTVIQKASTNLLAQIGATLRAHPEITRMRITVHVQPTKNADADQRLSETRAFAIREWLIKYGIDEKRLEPRGFGGTKPLVDPKAKGAAGINERIELIILEKS